MGRGAWGLAGLLLLAGLAHGALVIENAERKIDISTFVAHHKTRLTFRNDGSSPAAALVLCEPSSLLEHAAFLEVGPEDGSSKLTWRPFSLTGLPGAPTDVACREYQLPNPLKPGNKLSLRASGAYTHVMRPEPAEAAQSEPQRVVYHGTARISSPYAVHKQSTQYSLGSSGNPTFTRVEPTKRSGGDVTYGPYENTPPFTSEAVTLHYENNHPFAQVTELEREIEVSHWGNVYFEERYSLRHAGARVAGEWSRYDVQTKPQEYARAAIPALAATLPGGAHSLFFRDSIGNISSSETRYGLESVTVNMQPRFPLFGGWSIKFLFGWSLPLSKVVVKDRKTGRMALTATIGPSVHDLVVDELTVKVVLPEGATSPTVTSELPLAGEPEISLKYTYLDVMGRPVVVLRARNLVSQLNLPFKVEYNYSSVGLLQKPLLLTGFFGLLFAAAIVLNRGSGSLASSASVQAVVKPHAS